jgi:hypothetical protein
MPYILHIGCDWGSFELAYDDPDTAFARSDEWTQLGLRNGDPQLVELRDPQGRTVHHVAIDGTRDQPFECGEGERAGAGILH